MEQAEKGKRYARIFRKAGVLLGKGDIARAVELLKEGAQFAKTLGDRAMEQRFEDEIVRARMPARDLE